MKLSKLFLFTLPIFFGFLAAAVNFYFLTPDDVNTENETRQEYLHTASVMAEKRVPFEEYEGLFKSVAEKEGGAYAFALLKDADIPFGLDTHLLGHSIGDILFKQEGIAGMGLCTHDFRNACAHATVIGALVEDGVDALPKIREACLAAPGGKNAYFMCFHGLGHGVLAFNGYDMERTYSMCEQLGSRENNNQEAIECFGGAIMEINSGGGHDREIWSAQREKYLLPDDPFYVCDKPYVTDRYRSICYNYMVPYLIESLGGNMGTVDEEIFAKGFEVCEEIPRSELDVRVNCFGGFGKEFIGMATGRNFSTDFKPTTDHLRQMQEWCALAPSKDGYEHCSNIILGSLYWGGEYSYSTLVDYCVIENADLNDQCFANVVRLVDFYHDDVGYRTEFCNSLPEEQILYCRESLL